MVMKWGYNSLLFVSDMFLMYDSAILFISCVSCIEMGLVVRYFLIKLHGSPWKLLDRQSISFFGVLGCCRMFVRI